MASVLKPGVRSVMASSRCGKCLAYGFIGPGSGVKGGKSEATIQCKSAGTLAPPLSLRRKLCPPYKLFDTSHSLLAAFPRCAVRGLGRPAGRRRAVERHALNAAAHHLGLLRGERARVDPHPGDFRRQPPVFDLGTAV